MSYDQDASFAKLALTMDKLRQCRHVLGLQGSVAEPPLVEEAEVMNRRCVQTSVEAALVKAMRDKKSDNDTLRKQVQDQIKRLRGVKVKEKDVLHASMYRWAYQKLTHR